MRQTALRNSIRSPAAALQSFDEFKQCWIVFQCYFVSFEACVHGSLACSSQQRQSTVDDSKHRLTIRKALVLRAFCHEERNNTEDSKELMNDLVTTNDDRLKNSIF